jgi:hypothetical protein
MDCAFYNYFTVIYCQAGKKYTWHIMFWEFLFLCACSAFEFVDSGVSKNNAIGYTFLLLISITYLFTGLAPYFSGLRRSSLFSQFLHFVGIIIPSLFPHTLIGIIPRQNDSNSLLMFTSFFILVRCAKEYKDQFETGNITQTLMN